MKDLRTLLEASILDIEDTIDHGDKLANMDFETLLTATSKEQFEMYIKLMKEQTEESSKGPFSYKQLKKRKSYMYIFYDDWSDDGWAVAFVEKYPQQDPITDFNDDTYYVIFWDEYINSASCRYDDTGNSFTGLLEQDFGKVSMKGAYEIPKGLLSSVKAVAKNAEGY